MFKELEHCFGVSGLEEPVSQFLQAQLESLCEKTWKDSMGNLHGENHGNGKKILICTHMDEPGIIITEITEDGYLRFETVGEISPAFLVSKKVWIHGHPGIISLKAIHLTTKSERETPIKAQQLFVDIGAENKEEAKKIVEIGDYGVFDIPYVELANDFIKGRAIAGRMGCFAVLEMLKHRPNANLHVIFAVQHEIGNRGISPGIWNLDAEIAIVLDGTPAKIYPDVDESLPEAGNGVALLRRTGSGNTNAELYALAKKLAEEEGVSIQYSQKKEKGAESVIEASGKEISVLCLDIPVRYANTTAQVASKKDLHAMTKLAIALIEREGTQA